MADDPFDPQQTDDPIAANDRNFFKVEAWSKDNQRIERMLYAGNRLDVARATFDAIKAHRPRGRYTIRQRVRVLAKWPAD